MACRNGPVTKVSHDAVHGPVGGRTVALSRVAYLLVSITNKKTGFKPNELIVAGLHSDGDKWSCVSGTHLLTGKQKAGFCLFFREFLPFQR